MLSTRQQAVWTVTLTRSSCWETGTVMTESAGVRATASVGTLPPGAGLAPCSAWDPPGSAGRRLHLMRPRDELGSTTWTGSGSGLLSGIRVSKCEVYRASSEDGTDCTQCNAQTLTLPACRGQHAGTASDSDSNEEELSRLQADPEEPKRTQVSSCERICRSGDRLAKSTVDELAYLVQFLWLVDG